MAGQKGSNRSAYTYHYFCYNQTSDCGSPFKISRAAVTYNMMRILISGMLQANEASYGVRSIPSYHFDNAKVIVSLGADFLGTWLSPVEFARQYAKGRKIDEKAPDHEQALPV